MLVKIQIDKQKARSLKDIAKMTLERLGETNKEKYPINSLKDYYDILRSLMEALNSIEGVKIKGEGAHFEIINHICEKFNFGEQTTRFLQELRDYRNRISYEGFVIKSSYIKSNSNRIEEIIEKLDKLVEEQLM